MGKRIPSGPRGKTILVAIGKKAANKFRARYPGQQPPEREQHVDGAVRKVKCYYHDDEDLVREAINEVM
jgi:hypothetical protein